MYPGKPYFIGNIEYDILDRDIADILDMDNEANRGLKSGMLFSIDNLENERKKITKYYLTADTISSTRTISFTRLIPPKATTQLTLN